MNSEIFKGTGVALATPLKKDLSIDFEGLEKLQEHVTNGGVEYLVVMGTTGEAPTMSWEEKMTVLDFFIDHNTRGLPIVFGLGGNHTSEIVEKLNALKNKDIQGILSASPNYNKPSQEGIYQHYQKIADHSHLPVLLYNVPGRTASKISTETTVRLSQHPNIIGTKEASGDLIQSMEISQQTPDDFLLLSGDDALTVPMMSIGATGVISVVANMIPHKFSEMVRFALIEDFKSARKLNNEMLKAYELAGKEGNPVSIKAGLEAIELCNRSVRLPLVESSQALVDDFKQYVR